MRVRSAFGGSLHTDGADEKGGRVAAGQTCLPLAPREPGFLSTQMFAARTTRFLNSFLLIDTTATASLREPAHVSTI